MNDDLISIIVPVHNAENYLNKCIESIINQTYSNLEVILINDGSTDSSKKICDNWVKKDKRIKVFHQKNNGVSNARNKGLEYSNGSFITFIDSDDYVNKNYIEVLVKAAKEENADIVISNATIIKNGKKEKFGKNKEKKIYKSVEATKKMLEGGIFQSVCWGKLYKKDVLKEIKFNENLKICEDLDFLLKVFYNCEKVIFIPVHNYNYIINPSSAMHSNAFHKSEQEFDYCRRMLSKYKGTELEIPFIKRYINVNLSYAYKNKINKEQLEKIKKNINEYKKLYLFSNITTIKEKMKFLIVNCMTITKG